jgi:hypothetical protein
MKREQLSPTELFTNRPPNEHQAEILDQITQVMIEAGDQVVELLPDSRYRSLAMTKLEEASMWAKKACVFTT